MITYDVLRWVLPNTKCENSFSLCFIENDRCVTYPWTADAVCDQWIEMRIYGFCFLFFLKACHKGSEQVVGAQLTWHRSQGIGRPNARQSLILQTVPIDSHWYCMLEAGYRYNFWERVFKFPSSWVSVWSTERLKLTFLWAFSSPSPSFLFSYLHQAEIWNSKLCKQKPCYFSKSFKSACHSSFYHTEDQWFYIITVFCFL